MNRTCSRSRCAARYSLGALIVLFASVGLSVRAGMQALQPLHDAQQSIPPQLSDGGRAAWTLSSEDRDRLIAALRNRPFTNIRVISMAGDAESKAFASAIAEVFVAAGLTIASRSEQLYSNHPTGLGIVIADDAARPPGAEELVLALRAIGVAVESASNPDVGAGNIHVVVGYRPKEERAAWTLSPDDRDRLIAALRYRQIANIHLVSMAGDADSEAFANAIAEVFVVAGLTIASRSEQLYSNHPTGLGIVIADEAARPPGAEDIVRALRAIGVAVEGDSKPDVGAGNILVVVGYRPK